MYASNARRSSHLIAWSCALAAVAGLGLARAAFAQDKCTASGVMAGERFTANNCAVAFMPDEHSVTLWFNESPISADESSAFQQNAHAESSLGGKSRTMLLVAFCPGGGEAVAMPASVKSVDMELSHAKSAMAGRQWSLQPTDFKVDRMTGDLKPGGHLTGHITGSRTSDGRPYTWDLAFDVALPAKEALAGLTCR